MPHTGDEEAGASCDSQQPIVLKIFCEECENKEQHGGKMSIAVIGSQFHTGRELNLEINMKLGTGDKSEENMVRWRSSSKKLPKDSTAGKKPNISRKSMRQSLKDFVFRRSKTTNNKYTAYTQRSPSLEPFPRTPEPLRAALAAYKESKKSTPLPAPPKPPRNIDQYVDELRPAVPAHKDKQSRKSRVVYAELEKVENNGIYDEIHEKWPVYDEAKIRIRSRSVDCLPLGTKTEPKEKPNISKSTAVSFKSRRRRCIVNPLYVKFSEFKSLMERSKEISFVDGEDSIYEEIAGTTSRNMCVMNPIYFKNAELKTVGKQGDWKRDSSEHIYESIDFSKFEKTLRRAVSESEIGNGYQLSKLQIFELTESTSADNTIAFMEPDQNNTIIRRKPKVENLAAGSSNTNVEHVQDSDVKQDIKSDRIRDIEKSWTRMTLEVLRTLPTHQNGVPLTIEQSIEMVEKQIESFNS